VKRLDQTLEGINYKSNQSTNYATFKKGKINYGLLKDSSRMNKAFKNTPENVKEKLKTELKLLLSSLSGKEIVD
jgi:hypothetical protein